MSVKLRLQRKGRKKKPFYHIVAADVRAPRDGKFIEKIGTYNPMTTPATIDLDSDKALRWMENGALPSDTVRAILKFKGVLYRRHLLRGVRKGAFSQEVAEEKYNAFIDSKQEKVAARFEKTEQQIRDRHIAIFGKAPQQEAPAPEASAEEE